MAEPAMRRKAFIATPTGRWTYTVSGAGAEVILLLPGALGSEAARPLGDRLSAGFRVVSPEYGPATTMRQITTALTGILDAEDVRACHVVGGSYGGLVAQFLVAHEPARVDRVALIHSFVLSPAEAWRFRLGARLARCIPAALMRWLLRQRLNRLVLSPLRAAKHPDFRQWEEVVARARKAMSSGDAFVLQQQVLHDASLNWAATLSLQSTLTGRLLIVDSDNDPVIRGGARRALIAAYPGALVHTFKGTGHVTSLLKTEELGVLIRDFLRAPSA